MRGLKWAAYYFSVWGWGQGSWAMRSGPAGALRDLHPSSEWRRGTVLP